MWAVIFLRDGTNISLTIKVALKVSSLCPEAWKHWRFFPSNNVSGNINNRWCYQQWPLPRCKLKLSCHFVIRHTS